MPTFQAIGADPITYNIKPRPVKVVPETDPTSGAVNNQPKAQFDFSSSMGRSSDGGPAPVVPGATPTPSYGSLDPNSPFFLQNNNGNYGEDNRTPEQKAKADAINRPPQQPYQSPAVNEAQIREQELARQNARIDALNNLYKDEYRKASERATGRLGTQRAQSAARGTLGSDFGTAENAQVQDINTSEESAIRAKQAAEIQAIMNDSDKSIQDRVAKAQSLIMEQQDRAQKLQSEQSQLAIQQGTFDLQKEKAKQDALNAGHKPMELADGSIVDGITGNVIYKGTPKAPTYAAGSVGEYQFYAQQEKDAGRNPVSYNDYQNLDANRKAKVARAGSGGGSAGLSTLAQTVLANPSLFNQLTPTQKGSIAPELAAHGFDQFGKGLSDSAIKEVTQTQYAVKLLDDLQKTLDANKNVIGPITGFARINPWSDARQVQSTIDTARQIIGKALEGGVLRKEDEEKYKAIIPTINDTYDNATYKVNHLKDILQSQVATYQQAQGASGHNVQKQVQAPNAQPAQMKVGNDIFVLHNDGKYYKQ